MNVSAHSFASSVGIPNSRTKMLGRNCVSSFFALKYSYARVNVSGRSAASTTACARSSALVGLTISWPSGVSAIRSDL